MDRKAYVLQAGRCWIGFGYTNIGLCRIELSFAGPEGVERGLAAHLGKEIAFERPVRGSSLEQLPGKLISFFNGERVDFDEPVDLNGLTPFQKSVLAITRSIPFGEVRSYSWVANRAGNPRSCRAVGQALGRNPVAIVIPCHRVITSQGTLGGFGWGIDVKRMLLAIEATAQNPIN